MVMFLCIELAVGKNCNFTWFLLNFFSKVLDLEVCIKIFIGRFIYLA